MPTYRNALTTAYVADNIRLEPKEDTQTVIWLPALASGITKVSDSPYLDPIISSDVYTSGATVTVPATITGNYQVEIYCVSGSISIQYNATGAVARIMGAGDKVVEQCLSRTIDSIILVIASAGNCTITIKKI